MSIKIKFIFELFKQQEKRIKMSEIKAWISFYLELPFHLGLPTGHYALHIPNQLKLHRDLYSIQKGNEIENPSTLENFIAPQERLFNDKGLCSEEYKDLYKRKMKTTIFRKFTISYKLQNITDFFPLNRIIILQFKHNIL